MTIVEMFAKQPHRTGLFLALEPKRSVISPRVEVPLCSWSFRNPRELAELIRLYPDLLDWEVLKESITKEEAEAAKEKLGV